MKSRFLNAVVQRQLIYILSLSLSGTCFANEQSGEPLRRRLNPLIEKSFCTGNFNPQTLWQHGLYDAQVEGRRISIDFATSTGSLSLKALNQRGLSLASELGYASFSSGVCDKNSGWVVALPARKGVLFDKFKRVIGLPKENICQGEILARSVNNSIERSLELVVENFKIKGEFKQGDVVSIECLPSDKLHGVAREWFLIPIKGQFNMPPKIEIVHTLTVGDRDAILQWINSVRTAGRLSAIVGHVVLDDIAMALFNNAKVQHDVAKLVVVRDQMLQKKFQFIGENRVYAPTIDEALTLLWNSPRHRDLILEQSSDSAGLHIHKTTEGVFVGMLAGKKL